MSFQGNAYGFGSRQRDPTTVPLLVVMTMSRHEQGGVPTRDAQVMLTGMGMFQQTVDVRWCQRHTNQLPNNSLGTRRQEKELPCTNGVISFILANCRPAN